VTVLVGLSRLTALLAPVAPVERVSTAEERVDIIAGAVRTILEALGEDPRREGLLKTPERYAKALMFFSRGYEESLVGRRGAPHAVRACRVHSVPLIVPRDREQCDL
jgi:GTP cyclohydrolase I